MANFLDKLLAPMVRVMATQLRSPLGPASTGHGSVDRWNGDMEWALLQQDPPRARLIVRSAAVILVLLVIWAALAPIDEVTRGQARVVPSR